MPVDVLMPQMGESVTEGTVTKWLKKVGDTVGRDEPLFEISTDKVDAEIPSPVAGKLIEIMAAEGHTVAVHSVVAHIEAAGGAQAATPASKTAPAAKAPTKPAPTPTARVSSAPAPAPAIAPKESAPAPEVAARPAEDIRTSPLVRRIAAENNVDLGLVQGTGLGGRISKEDLLAYIETRQSKPAAARPIEVHTETETPVAPIVRGREEIVPLTPMRRKISEHMVLSRRTSAHVTTVFAVDFTKVVGIYNRDKGRFEKEEGTKLGFTPFFMRAIIDGLKRFPILNSSLVGDNVVYKKDVHLGVAVALEWGLIVPVVHHADEKSFLGLVRSVNDLAERARTKKLSLDEVQGGTFTITNPGVYGALFATPIINQPQVGIVGVGGINKTPVVINDAIAIRSIVHLSLSYDHRLIDGAVADQFMAAVKRYLENWEEDLL